MTRRIIVAPDDRTLPGMPTAPAGGTGAAGDGKEIPADGVPADTMLPDGHNAGQRHAPHDDPRPLIKINPSKRTGRTTLLLVHSMRAAREGRVVDLWNPEGSVALTYEDGAYVLTEQALVPTPWFKRVEEIIDRLVG